MKQKARKVIFGLSLRRLGRVETRTVRDTARSLILVRKMNPPAVFVDPKGRRFEIWDIDFEG